jgi:hypothetical protein
MIVEWEEIVERRVVKQIQEQLAKSGVEAVIERISTPTDSTPESLGADTPPQPSE